MTTDSLSHFDKKKSFREVVKLVCDEPFRLFFPVALLMGVLGVSLWPLFYGGYLDFYPMTSHAKIMIECFVGGFAIGFLTTALPKMLGVIPLRKFELLPLVIAYLSACALHVTGFEKSGDVGFVLTLLVLIALFLPRVLKRSSSPPPGFPLAALGILSGLISAGWSVFSTQAEYPQLDVFFRLLLYNAFILLPILGVGSFMFPMILGFTDRHATLRGEANRLMWRRRAAEGLIVGILIITSFWIESLGETKSMSWARALICFVYFTKESGWLSDWSKLKSSGIKALSIRLGILLLLAGMLARPFFEMQRIGIDHTLYIGGFGLITMIIATRVIFGHSGQSNKFRKWSKVLGVCTGLLIFTMATRISAEFLPAIRISHHVYAAFCWILVCIIWGVAILPAIRKEPKKRVPVVEPNKNSLLDMNFRK